MRTQKATAPPPPQPPILFFLSSKWSKGSPARCIWPAGLITSPGCDPLFLWWHGKFLVHAVGKVPLTETTGRAAVCQTYSGSRATPHFPSSFPRACHCFNSLAFLLSPSSGILDLGCLMANASAGWVCWGVGVGGSVAIMQFRLDLLMLHWYPVAVVSYLSIYLYIYKTPSHTHMHACAQTHRQADTHSVSLTHSLTLC